MPLFEEVYAWLNKYDDQDSYLGVSVQRLIGLMKQALADDDFPRVQYYINLALQVVESLDDISASHERAETHLECAQAYYQLEYFTDAISQFRQALSFYGNRHPHNAAVSYWLLGCTFWRIGKQSDAIVQWERSRQIFQRLCLTSPDTDWYASEGENMSNTQNEAIERGRWP